MAYSFLPLLIVAFSGITGLIAEGLCWLLVYRTSSYRRLEQEIEKANKKVAEASGHQSVGRNKKSKQEQRKDELMKASAGDIFRIQIKTAMIVHIHLDTLFRNRYAYRWEARCCCSTTSCLNCKDASQCWRDCGCSLDGIPVAKLPFEPPGFMRRATHRNLPGEDFTDCSTVNKHMECGSVDA